MKKKDYDEFRQRINDFCVHLSAEINVEANQKAKEKLWKVMGMLTLVEALFYEIKHIKEEEKLNGLQTDNQS